MPTDTGYTWPVHTRLTFGGTLGSEDIWTCGLRFKKVDQALLEPDAAQLDATMPSLVPALSLWMGDPGLGCSSNVHLTWLKLNVILGTGKQRELITHEHTFAAVAGSITSGAGNTPSPTQTWAQTLRTVLPRGRGHAGRIYPPWMVQNVGADGRVGPGTATSMATSTANMIQALCDALKLLGGGAGGNPVQCIIASPGIDVRGTLPLATPVLAVECDQRPDHILRRINKVTRMAPAPVVIPVSP